MGNNALHQLDVFTNEKSINSGVQWKSLFDVINMTSTSLGRRYLKNVVSIPLIDKIKIKERYDLIKDMIVDDNYLLFEELKCINDIERLHRRISLQLLHPYEFYNLLESYNKIINLFQLIKKNEKLKNLDNTDSENDLIVFIENYSGIFDLDEMMKYNLNDIFSSFLLKVIHLILIKFKKK